MPPRLIGSPFVMVLGDVDSIGGSAQWADRDATLEYVFAGRRIAAVTFKARVCAALWSTLPPEPSDAEAIAQLSNRSAVQLFSHPAASRLPHLALIGGAVRYVARRYDRFSVDTSGTFDEYLRHLSPKTRQTLKRKVRRYCAHVGSAEPWRRFTTLDELREFHTLARPVSAISYQERLLGAGLPSWAGLTELLRQANGARAFLLLHDSATVAFLFTPLYDRTARYTYLAYDPAYAAWSPGTVLQYFALRSMFDDPEVEQLDFAEGPGQHKACFATSSTPCADIYYFQPYLGSVAAVLAHLLLNAANRAAARVLEWLHVKARFRRLFRIARLD